MLWAQSTTEDYIRTKKVFDSVTVVLLLYLVFLISKFMAYPACKCLVKWSWIFPLGVSNRKINISFSASVALPSSDSFIACSGFGFHCAKHVLNFLIIYSFHERGFFDELLPPPSQHRHKKYFKMCINLWRCLIVLTWPCAVDRTLKASHWVTNRFLIIWVAALHYHPSLL